MPCSICKKNGHTKRTCKDSESLSELFSALDLSSSDLSSSDLLYCKTWKHTKTFKTIQKKETQLQFYTRMDASPEVLQLVALDSKPFGSVGEKIISELFGLGPRTSSQNDGTLNGKKIEIKCARYWAGIDDCKWQHLEPDHDYEYALFVILDFHGWKVWVIRKSQLMGLREKDKVKPQGKQGWWTTKSAMLPDLTPIHSVADLQAFLQTVADE